MHTRDAETTILLADDEPIVREELGALLEDEGYRVITAADGEEALALFRSQRPDMVITDVRMPRRSGLSLAVAVRNEDPTIPISVITGHGNEAMAIDALRAGVTDFINKPVRLEDLIAALTRMEMARRPLEHQAVEMPPSVVTVEQRWSYSLENALGDVPPFVDALLRRAAYDLDRGWVLDLSLALRELIQNAIEHGNLGISFEEKTQALEHGTLDDLLRARMDEAPRRALRTQVAVCRTATALQVVIRDQGAGFDWQKLPDPTDQKNLLSLHGRGVLLAQLSVDSVTYNAQGNEATVTKLLSTAPTPSRA